MLAAGYTHSLVTRCCGAATPAQRDGSDLSYTAHLPLVDALCGTTLQIPFLDGTTIELPLTDVISPLSIKVVRCVRGHRVPRTHARTQHARTHTRVWCVLRRGKGMPVAKVPGTFGNLMVRFAVSFPRSSQISDEQKKLLRAVLATTVAPPS